MGEPLIISQNTFELQPRISVLLPVYNGGEYLRQSLQSILNQQFSDFEFLIIDDCSTDGSFDFLKSQQDKRITLFKNEKNRGLFFNLNFLISKSNSTLIKLWAQDDVMYPQCLDRIISFHAKHSNIGFSYSGCDMIDENGIIKENYSVDDTPEIISTALHARIAYYTGSIAGNIANVCISKKALAEAGLFKEDMKISADFDMWVRLARNHETGFIKEKLIQLRDHKNQLSRNEKYFLNHVKEDLEVYRYLDGYVTPQQRKEGHRLMLEHKLVFYYTLMVKSFLKGRWETAFDYFRQLKKYNNFFTLSFSFLKNKMINPRKPDLFAKE